MQLSVQPGQLLFEPVHVGRPRQRHGKFKSMEVAHVRYVLLRQCSCAYWLIRQGNLRCSCSAVGSGRAEGAGGRARAQLYHATTHSSF